jgi:transposase-like protein
VVPQRCCLPRVYPAFALAERFHLPALRVDRRSVGDVAGAVALPRVPGQTSLTAGTIFQDTRKPLRMWFMAMWYVTNQKNGVSALGLQRVLGLGSYETAWTWLHKLRRAMVRPGRDALSGIVEVDETYVGGVEKGKRGRNTETKAIVAVAAEENGKGIGRIRLRHIKDVSGASLLPFVQSATIPGAVIHTDGWSGYSGLTAAGGHRGKCQPRSGSRDDATRPQHCSASQAVVAWHSPRWRSTCTSRLLP